MHCSLKRLAAAALAVGATLAVGCEGPIDDTSGSVHFSPLETQSVTPETVSAPPMVPEGGREQVRAIVDGFAKNADVFFRRGDPEGRLPQIESVFITSGRYLDLVGIYQNVVEKQGISSPATARLARAYLRLGQDHLARGLLDRMIAERASDPITWFLNGAYWLPKAENSQEAAAKVIANWQKALEVDPEFAGFEQPGAPSLREQLAALRQRTPDDEVQEAIAELNEAPVADAETEPVAEAQPVAEPEPDTETEPVAVTVARGQMAMSQGQPERAERFFNQALERAPNNVEARLGLIQNAWSDETKRNELARSLRQLAERDDLTPRQQYEIGLFAFTKMDDNELAAELWTQAKERDPGLAEAVGLDTLIERATR